MVAWLEMPGKRISNGPPRWAYRTYPKGISPTAPSGTTFEHEDDAVRIRRQVTL
jgi:hypothetical protein